MIRLIISLLLSCAITQSAIAQDIVQTCVVCKGVGTHECTLCKGKGKWKVVVDGKSKKVECPACKATEVQPCWLCYGTGKHVVVVTPQTDTTHPERFSWLWCSSCDHTGVIVCSRCMGRGNIYGLDGAAFTCTLCNGKRYVLCNRCEGSCGWYVKRERCDICEGNGTLTCDRCNGQGWLPPERVENALCRSM